MEFVGNEWSIYRMNILNTSVSSFSFSSMRSSSVVDIDVTVEVVVVVVGFVAILNFGLVGLWAPQAAFAKRIPENHDLIIGRGKTY